MEITKELIKKAQIEINNKFKNAFFVESIKELEKQQINLNELKEWV